MQRARGDRLVLVALLALAVATRAVYFREIAASPLVDLHRWQESDMYFFDQWARHLAAGDWLQRVSLHPLLDWHRSLVEHWLALHPEASPGGEDPVGGVHGCHHFRDSGMRGG